jgi:hypothetical protein
VRFAGLTFLKRWWYPHIWFRPWVLDLFYGRTRGCARWRSLVTALLGFERANEGTADSLRGLAQAVCDDPSGTVARCTYENFYDVAVQLVRPAYVCLWSSARAFGVWVLKVVSLCIVMSCGPCGLLCAACCGFDLCHKYIVFCICIYICARFVPFV